MDKNKINENDSRDSLMAHFQKINIFGSSNVGKSSLILSIEKYLEKDFKIEVKEEENKEEQPQPEKEENTGEEGQNLPPPKLIQQLKRVNLSYNEKSELFLDLYETNIDNLEFLKHNIDTLITYSECLIFMIDIASINSFTSISQLLPLIAEIYKDKDNNDKPPMILINNKNDLETSREVSGFEIKEFIDQYPGMINIELSLLEKNSFQEFFQKLVEILKNEEKKDIYDHIHLVKIKNPPSIQKHEEEKANLAELSLNLFLLGSSTVGKTSFIKKFLKFDVTNKSTYDDVTGWIKDIREARGTSNINGVNDKKSSNEILFLIGNKIDEVKKRVVSKEEAKQLADSFGVSYFEVSCKDGVNVYEVLCKLIFEAFSFAKGSNQNFKLNGKTKKSKKKKFC